MSIVKCQADLKRLHENLARVIQGKADVLDIVVVALAAGGSILMEDVPGVGKTTLAKALAKSLDASFNRIQFTPDLLPADILGSSIYDPSNGQFSFHEGPVFCNILLADEINRASPRTQSALLEAMSEQQATIEGRRFQLPAPFFVVATQNPVEFHGTYPLPEAQLDRFMVLVNLGYPDHDATKQMLFAQAVRHPLEEIASVLEAGALGRVQDVVRSVTVEDSVAGYAVRLAEATRVDKRVKLGAGPRGIIMLFRAAQAAALYEGRDYVTPGDVQRMAIYVLPHRLMLTTKARYGGAEKATIVADILGEIEVPT